MKLDLFGVLVVGGDLMDGRIMLQNKIIFYNKARSLEDIFRLVQDLWDHMGIT